MFMCYKFSSAWTGEAFRETLLIWLSPKRLGFLIYFVLFPDLNCCVRNLKLCLISKLCAAHMQFITAFASEAKIQCSKIWREILMRRIFRSIPRTKSGTSWVLDLFQYREPLCGFHRLTGGGVTFWQISSPWQLPKPLSILLWKVPKP